MILIEILFSMMLVFLIYDLLKKHLQYREDLFLKEFNHKKYGDILYEIESLLSKIIFNTKIYISLQISKKLITDQTQVEYIKRIEEEIRTYSQVIKDYQNTLEDYKCKAFSVTPYIQELITKCCKEMTKLLKQSSSEIIAVVYLIDINSISSEELYKVQEKLSTNCLISLNRYADMCYKKYQDLCSELL